MDWRNWTPVLFFVLLTAFAVGMTIRLMATKGLDYSTFIQDIVSLTLVIESLVLGIFVALIPSGKNRQEFIVKQEGFNSYMTIVVMVPASIMINIIAYCTGALQTGLEVSCLVTSIAIAISYSMIYSTINLMGSLLLK